LKESDALVRYILINSTPPECYYTGFRRSEVELLRVLGLDSAKGKKRVYNLRHRLKELALLKYPKFVDICDLHNVDCPEDNNWTYKAFGKIPNTSQEKSPLLVQSPLKMTRFKTIENRKLLLNGGIGDDDDENGKSLLCLIF
jgi:hypothetical protein